MPVADKPLYPYPNTGLGWLDALLKGMQSDPLSVAPGGAGVLWPEKSSPQMMALLLTKYPMLARALDKIPQGVKMQYDPFIEMISPNALGQTRFAPRINLFDLIFNPTLRRRQQDLETTMLHESLHALYGSKELGQGITPGKLTMSPPTNLTAPVFMDKLLRMPEDLAAPLISVYAKDPAHGMVELMANRMVKPNPTLKSVTP